LLVNYFGLLNNVKRIAIQKNKQVLYEKRTRIHFPFPPYF
jgi:hypothetical protein